MVWRVHIHTLVVAENLGVGALDAVVRACLVVAGLCHHSHVAVAGAATGVDDGRGVRIGAIRRAAVGGLLAVAGAAAVRLLFVDCVGWLVVWVV